MPASSAPISCIARRWPGRCATRRSNCPNSKARSPAPPSARWHWSCGCSRTSSRKSWRGGRRSPRRPPHSRHWTLRRRMPNAPSRAIGSGPRSTATQISRPAGGGTRGGRHPTVEAALAGRGAFVANDCALGEDRIWLVTGPNMAGKSTFLRQNALIAILAQIGAFVPARSAKIGIVDRLYSRVGAADDLARGRSTFMVEMVETAAILNQAGPQSFVILDEIGRGTATFDGLSIAWAALEHLHEVNRSRALFATHYHELTALAAKLPALACHTMRVKEWQGDVVFLHEVAARTPDRPHGHHFD